MKIICKCAVPQRASGVIATRATEQRDSVPSFVLTYPMMPLGYPLLNLLRSLGRAQITCSLRRPSRWGFDLSFQVWSQNAREHGGDLMEKVNLISYCLYFLSGTEAHEGAEHPAPYHRRSSDHINLDNSVKDVLWTFCAPCVVRQVRNESMCVISFLSTWWVYCQLLCSSSRLNGV